MTLPYVHFNKVNVSTTFTVSSIVSGDKTRLESCRFQEKYRSLLGRDLLLALWRQYSEILNDTGDEQEQVLAREWLTRTRTFASTNKMYAVFICDLIITK
jgi:hypothetical protein